MPEAHAEGTRDAEGTYGAPAPGPAPVPMQPPASSLVSEGGVDSLQLHGATAEEEAWRAATLGSGYWQSQQVQAPASKHSRGSRRAAGQRKQLQQQLQLLPNPNCQPLPWQGVKQPGVPAYAQSNNWQEDKEVPACVQSGWPLFSDTGEDADPKPKPNPNPNPNPKPYPYPNPNPNPNPNPKPDSNQARMPRRACHGGSRAPATARRGARTGG
eukprot:scaffold61196_cov63-Phaeocystis_antarctica.AAC.7